VRFQTFLKKKLLEVLWSLIFVQKFFCMKKGEIKIMNGWRLQLLSLTLSVLPLGAYSQEGIVGVLADENTWNTLETVGNIHEAWNTIDDILADLVSMLFSGLMAFSALINDGEDLALSQEGEVSEGEQQGQAQRDESVDVNKARLMASMNYDMEYPEQQQQQSIRRI